MNTIANIVPSIDYIQLEISHEFFQWKNDFATRSCMLTNVAGSQFGNHL